MKSSENKIIIIFTDVTSFLLCCFLNFFFYSYQLKEIVLTRSSYCKFSKFCLIPKSKSSQNFWLKKLLLKMSLHKIKKLLRNFFLCERKPSLKLWNFFVSKNKYLKNLRKLVLVNYIFFDFVKISLHQNTKINALEIFADLLNLNSKLISVPLTSQINTRILLPQAIQKKPSGVFCKKMFL